MITRSQAMDLAAVSFAEAELGIRRGTVREAALRAYTPTGPSLAELEARITEIRNRDLATDPAGSRHASGDDAAAQPNTTDRRAS